MSTSTSFFKKSHIRFLQHSLFGEDHLIECIIHDIGNFYILSLLWEKLKRDQNMIVLIRNSESSGNRDGARMLVWDASGKCIGERTLTTEGKAQAKRDWRGFSPGVVPIRHRPGPQKIRHVTPRPATDAGLHVRGDVRYGSATGAAACAGKARSESIAPR